MQQLPTNRELLGGNRDLPGDSRQSMVRLRFIEPIPKGQAPEFLRIHMTPAMLAGGEQDYYRVALSQPHKAQPRRCSGCKGQMQQLGVWDFTCRNPACRNFGRVLNGRPLRGVVRVLYAPDWVQVREDGVKVLTDLVLVLDRRYRENVLAAVYRTAGQLAEMKGWRIK